MRTISTNSLSEGVWQYLEVETSSDAIIPRVRSKKRAAVVESCIKQAREYYSAARSASIYTKPTLLYYGMVNLSKALVLIKSPQTNVDSFKHGLYRRYSPKVDSLLKLSCRVDLSSPSEIKELLYLANSDWYADEITVDTRSVIRSTGAVYNSQAVTIGKVYSVRRLFPLLPELFDILLVTGLEVPRAIPVSYFHYYETTSDGKLRNFQLFLRHDKDAKVKSLVRSYERKDELAGWNFEEDSLDVIKYRLQGPRTRTIAVPFRESIYGGKYLVLPKTYKTRMSEAPTHFILMFILGDVARYTPQTWSRLLVKDSRVARIIETFLEVSSAKFPLLMLREIMNELVRFKTS